MTKSHGVGYFSDKDRRRVRRSYKERKDYKKRASNPKHKDSSIDDFLEEQDYSTGEDAE